MRNYLLACPLIKSEKKFLLQAELSLSVGRASFNEILEDIWLVRCDFKASDLHIHLEQILTKDVEFIIYELAEETDFVHNLDDRIISWASDLLL